MPNLLPLIEDEAGNVYNKAALGTLRAGQDADNALAAQLAAGNGAPLTQNPFATALAGIKVPSKQAPMPTDLKVDLNKPISADLGDVIPNPDNTIKIPQQAAPSAPASTGNVDPDVVSKWKQWYPGAGASAAAAGLGVAAGLGSSGGNPEAQAAKPTKSPEDDIPQDELDALDALVKGDGGNSSTSTGRKPSASDDDESESPSNAPAKPTDNSPENLASVDKLMQMQQKAGQMQAVLGGLRGVTDAVATASGKHENLFDKSLGAMQAQAGELPSNYAQAVDFQKQDPNSAISRTFRELAGKLGMKIPPQASAAQLEKPIQELGRLQEMQARIAELHEYHQGRIQSQKEAAALRNETKINHDQDKWDTSVDKAITSVGKTLDPALQRQNTAYGKAAMNLQTIQRIKLLMNGGITAKDLSQLPDQSVFEINTAIAQLAGSGAVPTEFSIKHMDKNNAIRDIQNFKQWITGNPVGAQQGQQMLLAKHTLDRQEQAASDAIINSQKRALSPIFKAYFDPRTSDDHKAAIQNMLVTNQLPIDTLERMQAQQLATKNGQSAPASKQQPSQVNSQQSPSQASSQKTVVRKGYNAKTNQTQLIYDDGSKEVVDGRQ